MKKKTQDQLASPEIQELASILARVHPGCGRVPWFKALRAIHYETGGSDAGFELANRWSKQGHNYMGREDVRKYWQSIKPSSRPVTILSLVWMARLMKMLYGVRRDAANAEPEGAAI